LAAAQFAVEVGEAWREGVVMEAVRELGCAVGLIRI
jgi:hypothetical protein